MPELTGPQLPGGSWGGGVLLDPNVNPFTAAESITYATYRAMRKQPTIAMVRVLITAGVVSGGWDIEENDDAPDGAYEFISKQLGPIRAELVEKAILGGIDFGWAPFEKIFAVAGGQIVIDRVKPLLQDLTDIVIDDAGNFVAFKQPWGTGSPVRVPYERCLLVSWRKEGSNHYGTPLIESSRASYNAWNTVDGQADIYDAKVVGTRYVVYYPPGTTDVDGVETSNSEIAADVMTELESSGSVGVPTTVADYVDELNSNSMGWRIETVGDRGPAPTLMERMRYLDALMCRGMGMPERTMLEGASGDQRTGVETAHAFAVKNLQMAAEYIARIVNANLVDQLLLWNYGAAAVGSVYIQAGPIDPRIVMLFSDLAKQVLAGQPEAMDLGAVMDAVRIPKAAENVEAKALNVQA